MKFITIILTLLFVLPAGSMLGQTKEKILVLPFKATGIDSISALTATGLLRKEVDRAGKFEVVSEVNTPMTLCGDIACAVDIGKSERINNVVYGSYSRLGSKVIVEYVLVDVRKGASSVSGDLSATSLDDLDATMSGIAHTVSTGEKVQRFGSSASPHPTVVINKLPYQGYVGGSIGQMYRSSGYPEDEKAIVFDARLSLEYPTYALNLISGWRVGPMISVGASYYILPGSISPYIGAGFGYHLITTGAFTDPYASEPVFASGFQTMMSVGVEALRTNDLHVLLNLDYMLTFDGRNDKAFVLTLGLLGDANIRF